MDKMDFLPLAITDVNDTEVCICGLNETGQWIRPEKVYRYDIFQKEADSFAYGCITQIFTEQSSEPDRRIEDRELLRDRPILKKSPLTRIQIQEILRKKKDGSVKEGLAHNRSACLIRPQVTGITYGRTLGGRDHIRIIFEDEVGDSYNFIAADIRFKELVKEHIGKNNKLDENAAEGIIQNLNQKESYFTITLTKIVHEYQGPFRGCHGLVAGVHILDDE